jgi:hydroxyacylglutathione hydrolase
MPLEIVTIPCLSDNYAFLLHSSETGETAVVDVPDAGPILDELKTRGWQLTEIWITHHHYDHIDGVSDLKEATGAKVVGASADAGRLPPLNLAVEDGETFSFAEHEVIVFDVSGHTVGHIAFHVPDAVAVFTADSLMALGCGRLFEGTPDQMWASLSRLAKLPPETLVCTGHEYTQSNAKFALTIEKTNADLKSRSVDINAARAAEMPTVPSTLALELATNPFLRAHLPQVKAAIGMENETDTAVFAEIRKRKDAF